QTQLIKSYINALSMSGNNIFAGTLNNVYHTSNYGNTWKQTGLKYKRIYSLATKGNIIIAGTNDSGVYLSTNNGNNWTQTDLNNKTIYSLTFYGNIIFSGTEYDGVYKST